MLKNELRHYSNQDKVNFNKQLKKEGYNLNLDKETTQEQIVSKVSTEVPEKAKITKDEKQSFEEFKEIYKGQIDEKCLAEYGDTEDKDLWEDCAKEMYLQSTNYIPDSEDKPQGELVEGKGYTGQKVTDVDIDKDIPIQTVKDNNGTAFDIYYKDGKYVDGNGCEVEDSVLEKYKLKENPEPIFSEVKRNIDKCTNCNQLFTYIGTLKEQLDEDFYSKLEEVIYNTDPMEEEKDGNGNALEVYKQNLLEQIDAYVDSLNLNESKEIKTESVIDDYAKLKTQLNKEKQFNKKIEINSNLNKLVRDNNLEFKDQSSGNDNYEYQQVLSNGKNIGTIQISKNGKVSVYKTETIEYEKDYQTIFSEIDLKDIGSAVYDCIKENKLSEAAVQVILNKLESTYNVKVED